MEKKTCKKCNEEKLMTKFTRQKWKLKNGTFTYYRSSLCTSCSNKCRTISPEKKKLYRIKHKDKNKAYQSTWKKNASEKLADSYIKGLLYKCKVKVTLKSIKDKRSEVIKKRANMLDNSTFLFNISHLCNKCKKTKSAENFSVIKYDTKAGIRKSRSSTCKKCTNTIVRKFSQHQRNTLSDNYIKKTITAYSILYHADIPQKLIDLKRKELQFKRMLNLKLKTKTNG